MPFIPCGFTPAKRANRDTDARQVHENTGASRARSLSLCLTSTHGWIHRTGRGSHMDRDEHTLGSADFFFQLLDFSYHWHPAPNFIRRSLLLIAKFSVFCMHSQQNISNFFLCNHLGFLGQTSPFPLFCPYKGTGYQASRHANLVSMLLL